MRLTDAHGTLLRRPLVAAVLDGRQDILVVSGLGGSTYDVAASGYCGPFFPFWGAMGLSAICGLGLAMSQPDRRVLVVTGDGEMMMGIGSLATIASIKPRNLAILVLDNQSFGETGRQAGLTGGPADLVAIAKGAGFVSTVRLTEAAGLDQAAALLFDHDGPVICVADVALSNDPKILPERDGVVLAKRFEAMVAQGLSRTDT